MKFSIFNFQFSNRGFTLLETLVAVVLLATAIAGPLTIASKGIQATTIAKDQDTAFYLAQDAVEYIRWVRDTNKLSGGDWLTGAGGGANATSLAACVSANGTNACHIDSLQNIVTNCDAVGSCNALNYNAANNSFNYDTGNTSIFKREVVITTPVGSGSTLNNNEAAITVTVSWSDQTSAGGKITRQVVVRENIYNWQ